MADRIQRKTKKQRYVPLELPVEGDALLFRYPNSVTFKHFVYDDFPQGRKSEAMKISWTSLALYTLNLYVQG